MKVTSQKSLILKRLLASLDVVNQPQFCKENQWKSLGERIPNQGILTSGSLDPIQ